MSAGDFFIVALMLFGFFWIIGKLFIKALKFVLIASLGFFVVAAVILSPIWLAYGAGIALFGAYAFFSKSEGNSADQVANLEEEAEQ